MIYLASYDEHTLDYYYPVPIGRILHIGWSDSALLANLFANKFLEYNKPSVNSKTQVTTYKNMEELKKFIYLKTKDIIADNSIYGAFEGAVIPKFPTARISTENCRITTITDKHGTTIAITNEYLKRRFMGNFQSKIRKIARQRTVHLILTIMLLQVNSRLDADIKYHITIMGKMIEESIRTNHGQEIDYNKYAIDSEIETDFYGKV